jgi:protein-L-isoaspartate(D-aspartate) O-methyltransferase
MDAIEDAFAKVDRANFVPDHLNNQVFIDAPLPIGFGQTISQPTTVKMMLEWLEPQPGDKVLDVGSGSGWTAALLAHLVGPKGNVYALELIPELVEFGRQNAQRAGVANAKFFQAGKNFGQPKYAPYDGILVSAAARKVPQELIDQLADGGKMVIPVNNDILEIEKDNGQTSTKKHPGFVFVPLIDGSD